MFSYIFLFTNLYICDSKNEFGYLCFCIIITFFFFSHFLINDTYVFNLSLLTCLRGNECNGTY